MSCLLTFSSPVLYLSKLSKNLGFGLAILHALQLRKCQTPANPQSWLLNHDCNLKAGFGFCHRTILLFNPHTIQVLDSVTQVLDCVILFFNPHTNPGFGFCHPTFQPPYIPWFWIVSSYFSTHIQIQVLDCVILPVNPHTNPGLGFCHPTSQPTYKSRFWIVSSYFSTHIQIQVLDCVILLVCPHTNPGLGLCHPTSQPTYKSRFWIVSSY